MSADKKRATPAAQTEPESSMKDRRETLAVVGKFAAFVAPVTIVLLTAEQAQAVPPNCSTNPTHPQCVP